MTEKKDVVAYCLTFQEVYEDYPFHDPNWCVMRHKGNRKVFAWIFHREGHVWVNVKCDPEWRDFWRQAYPSVVPAYHLNKEHWNSIILDGSVPEQEIQRMIGESYGLTGGDAALR
ncbi:MAG: MmcQ/YjbR family DNA-binding protein [Lachnospiraceae bacterium]|nr:MmcQ/YjbR family DNA-binding protein [Lachnospiraceae bacterium]